MQCILLFYVGPMTAKVIRRATHDEHAIDVTDIVFRLHKKKQFFFWQMCDGQHSNGSRSSKNRNKLECNYARWRCCQICLCFVVAILWLYRFAVHYKLSYTMKWLEFVDFCWSITLIHSFIIQNCLLTARSSLYRRCIRSGKSITYFIFAWKMKRDIQ